MFRAKTAPAITALCFAFGLFTAGCKDSNPNANNGAPPSGTPATSSGTASSGGGSGEITIGEYGSLTGSEANFGHSTDEGMRLAVEERNAAGGLDMGGKKVKINFPATEDDASDAPKAETAVKRLIDDKGVIAILGEVASSNSLAGGKVCQARGIPMISPSSTNEKVTQIGDYIFRVCFLDSYQAAVVARFAKDGLKAQRAAIFTNKSQTYSVGFSDEFEKAFTKYGGQIVAKQSYSPTDQDFSGALNSIKNANPDVILVPGYYSDAGSIVKQARSLGITKPILGGDGWDGEDLFKIGGSAVEGCYFSDHMAINDPRPKVQNFVKAYQAKYNKVPLSLAALGYDAANLLMDAIQTAKSTDKKAIRDAIAATKSFDGVTGQINIDANRNAQKSAVIIAVKNGKFNYEATIANPDQPMTTANK